MDIQPRIMCTYGRRQTQTLKEILMQTLLFSFRFFDDINVSHILSTLYSSSKSFNVDIFDDKVLRRKLWRRNVDIFDDKVLRRNCNAKMSRLLSFKSNWHETGFFAVVYSLKLGKKKIKKHAKIWQKPGFLLNIFTIWLANL